MIFSEFPVTGCWDKQSVKSAFQPVESLPGSLIEASSRLFKEFRVMTAVSLDFAACLLKVQYSQLSAHPLDSVGISLPEVSAILKHGPGLTRTVPLPYLSLATTTSSLAFVLSRLRRTRAGSIFLEGSRRSNLHMSLTFLKTPYVRLQKRLDLISQRPSTAFRW